MALELGGEVVNADSRLFYRGMDVPTAKPTKERQKAFRTISSTSWPQTISTAWQNYLKKARSAISEILDRGNLPILVGGSGQYVWAIIEGWNVPEIQPNPSCAPN
ncbi:MAG: hypothetical protein Ct9H300mP19_17310 [Dehalococcoidia bacterium]|nr:MAG: hypothetical protein Ct9H300mP19_17310 [Dehalococcoidia bacterium]